MGDEVLLQALDSRHSSGETAASAVSAAIVRPAPRRRAAAVEEPEPSEATLFAAALGRASGRQLVGALRKGMDPSHVALEQCACMLPEAECVCLGYSPLHCACQTGLKSAVYAMLAAAANPDTRSGRIMFSLSRSHRETSQGLIVADGLTPLHVAAACGHRRIVELLLRHHADPLVAGAEPRKTPLGFALAVGQREVAEVLRRAAVGRVLERALASAPEVGSAEACLASQCSAQSAEGGRGGLSAALEEHPKIEALRKRIRAREACPEY